MAEACARAKVKRFVHCSTVGVWGKVSVGVIDEETPCKPKTEYGITKLAIEQILQEKSRNAFETVILRPTIVFGPGNIGLQNLADRIMRKAGIENYIRSCLLDRRRLNLVCVDNVTGAIAFFIDTEKNIDGGIFIVSDDEDPSNNYRFVEKYLMNSFGRRDYSFPRIAMPSFILARLLRLLGRPNVNPHCIYDGEKLRSTGFKKPVSFEEGLASFAEWYKEVQRVRKSA